MENHFKKLIFLVAIISVAICFHGYCGDLGTNYISVVGNSGNSSSGTQDTLTSFLRLIGAFIFVVALFLSFAWLFKYKNGFLNSRSRKGLLRIVEIKHIGGRQALIVAGYGKERMLLGVTPTNINFLSKLPDDIEKDSGDNCDVNEQSFVTLLKNSLKR